MGVAMTPDANTMREIARLCTYITDDGAVAAYFNIDRKHVAEVRKTHRVTPPRAMHVGRERYERGDEHPSSGINKQLFDRANATAASERMLRRLNLAFDKHARKHGYTFEQSRLLCANSTERMA